jgi:hypothetical protein
MTEKIFPEAVPLNVIFAETLDAYRLQKCWRSPRSFVRYI